MCKASQGMQASSGWLRLAGMRRNAELADALKSYAPGAKTAHAIGPALKALVGPRFEYDGEWFELVERYFPGDAANRYGVRGPMRERIRAQRASAKEREARIQADALEIAKRLRRGIEAPALVIPIAPGLPSDHGRLAALEETRRAGWLSPSVVQVRAPPALPEPAPLPPADTSNWPRSWLVHGRPDYLPRTREAPDERYKNGEAMRAGPNRAAGAELASFIFNSKNNEKTK